MKQSRKHRRSLLRYGLHRPARVTLLRTGIFTSCLLLPAAVGVVGYPAQAQVVSSTIAGIVTDSTGAVIPGAQVQLINRNTNDKRTSSTNGSGTFRFTGLPSGDFNVIVTAPGFQTFTENSVHLDPGDSRSLQNLKLATGQESQTVTVEAETSVALDSGERSDLITAEEIKHLSVEGRDVTELLRTLPGFAIASASNTNVNNQAVDTSQVSPGGFIGGYSANGNLASGNTLRLDGANLTDPGSNSLALQTVNYDQVSEVKTQTSNFGAEYANGPIVVSAVTKSGTDHFHGSLYAYARTYQLNSTDALAGATGQGKDPDREVYPGFTIGGPVIVPGTNFNKHRALTFFAGAEDYAQRNVYAYGSSGSALVHALVPTPALISGNFSPAALQQYLGGLYTNSAYANVAQVPTYGKFDAPIVGTNLGTPSLVNGQVPASLQDPGFKYIANLYPTPNNVPTLQNPYNWQGIDYINNDLWQAIGRVDLAISERNHFFARYSVERGVSGEPAAVYYNPNGINTPGGGASKTNSEAEAANLTTIISPSLTNQIYVNVVYLSDGFSSNNLSTLTGYPYQGAYANGKTLLPELQAYNSPSGSGGLPLGIFPDYTQPIFTHKFDPEAGDNVTKVWGVHTATFGYYGTRVTNNQTQQPQNGYATNGYISNYYLPGAGATLTDLPVNGVNRSYTLSGNYVADELEGFVGGYGQYNVVPQANLYFWDNAFFATDAWKVTRRLTLNYGVRLDHLGLWNDQHSAGVALFDPALISAPANSPYPGFTWHALNPSLPKSGNRSQPLYVEPRFGIAYDVFGTGKTVVRGGWGEYRGHDSWNDTSTALSVTQQVSSVSYGASSLAAIGQQNVNPNTAALPNTTAISTTTTLNALTPGDRQQPLADTYSLTVNQALPSHLNAFISYVGDNNRFLINGGSTQPVSLNNVNVIPIGGLYRPDPDTASPNYGRVLTPLGLNPANTPSNQSLVVTGANAQQQNEYRPLNTPRVQYGPIDVVNHNLFANYNGLQLGVSRQTGRVLFNVNYTLSHALGVRGAGANDSNGFPSDPINPYNDYGTESFDRRHIFNASYTFEVGTPVRSKLIGAFTNGWEISGITNIQSGPDISSITFPNLGLTGNIGAVTSPANPNIIATSNVEYLGTPDYNLQPTVLSNPKAGLGLHQYINGAAFGTPNFLQQGQYILPRLTGPTFFDTDLSAQKSFNFADKQAILFRFSSFNFINHGLTTLSNSFNNEYTLNFTNTNSTSYVQNGSNTSLGFGTLPYKTGRRIVELEAKYTF